MALFDKIKKAAEDAKNKVSNFAEEKKIGEKFANIKASAKKSWEESTAAMKQSIETTA